MINAEQVTVDPVEEVRPTDRVLISKYSDHNIIDSHELDKLSPELQGVVPSINKRGRQSQTLVNHGKFWREAALRLEHEGFELSPPVHIIRAGEWIDDSGKKHTIPAAEFRTLIAVAHPELTGTVGGYRSQRVYEVGSCCSKRKASSSLFKLITEICSNTLTIDVLLGELFKHKQSGNFGKDKYSFLAYSIEQGLSNLIASDKVVDKLREIPMTSQQAYAAFLRMSEGSVDTEGKRSRSDAVNRAGSAKMASEWNSYQTSKAPEHAAFKDERTAYGVLQAATAVTNGHVGVRSAFESDKCDRDIITSIAWSLGQSSTQLVTV